MTGGPPEVRRFYERNTARFLAWGQGRRELALHREVRAPGVRTRSEGFRHVEGRLAEWLLALHPAGARLRLLDLGCGVGGTLLGLAERLQEAGREVASGVGLTLSPAQVERAAGHLAARGLSDRLEVRLGDFHEAPLPPERDLVVMIESLAHAHDPEAVLVRAAGVLAPGGLLAVCDDLLERPPATAREARWLADFRDGWKVTGPLSPRRLHEVLGGAGLEPWREEDLTPHLVLGRPRDQLVALLVGLLGRWPAGWPPWDALHGGHALQRLLRAGVVGYRLVAYRRPPGA